MAKDSLEETQDSQKQRVDDASAILEIAESKIDELMGAKDYSDPQFQSNMTSIEWGLFD